MSLWVQSLLEGVAEGSAPTDFPLRVRSTIEWARHVTSDMNQFLVDHAACERKASATAMSFVVKYTDKPEFVEAMIQVARDELEHFQQVYRVVRARGLQLSGDEKNEYMNLLLQECRNSPQERFMDRLLCFSIVEARGCERFALVAQALREKGGEDELCVFYDRLSREEAKHFGLFVRYALKYFPMEAVSARLGELLEREAQIVQTVPWGHALH